MNNNKFNNNIFKIIDICNKDNVIVSGLSIKMALAMLLNGAKGESKDQLINFFDKSIEELNNETKERLLESNDSIKFANAFWFRTPNEANEEYAKIIKEFQNAQINIDDFSLKSTLDKINNWVSDNTNGLIEKILDNISGVISLLINTLYFKDSWSNPFEERLTHDEIFYGLKNNNVKMMKNTTKYYFENKYAKGFGLYYENSPYEFIGILPNNEGNFKIEDLDLNNFNHKSGNYNVYVDFPKLDIEFSTELSDCLKKLGVEKPFAAGDDFTSMLSVAQTVDKVIHKTNFKLDEKGTEAAAATVVLMVRGASMRQQDKIEINLKFNRPFAFMIRHIKTNELLFVGKISNL